MTGLYGKEFDVNRVLNIGAETLRMEFEFNEKAGFTKEDDKLPDFFYNEVAPGCDMKWRENFSVGELLEEIQGNKEILSVFGYSQIIIVNDEILSSIEKNNYIHNRKS